MPKIEIVPYRSAWRDAFQQLAATIRAVAPPGAILHHIGSTAVPGLAAKDVIDIQMTVTRLDDVDIDALVQRGFTRVRALTDHAPPGVVLPDAELRKLFFNATAQPANLHVRERGRFNQRYPLLCRDFLRAMPEAALAYEAVKRELAARFPDDANAYYAIKDPVFDILMTGANMWAEAVAWREPPED